MRFSLAVDSLSRENAGLKRAISLLICVVGILGILAYALFDKQPIVIERSTRGLEVIRPTEFKPSEIELKRGIEIMLKARFDTTTLNPELFLSPRQLALRVSEQRELKNRNIEQNVVIRKIQLSKNEAFIDFDRLLAVGEIRSALKTKIKVAFEEVSENELNPYGLRLAFAESVDTNQTKEVKK
jgi:hypothetical protein